MVNPSETQPAEPLLRLRGLTKRFAGVAALDNVDFTVRAGEIHALLGENGAGKSTLIKVLTGVHTPDAGEITFLGQPFHATCPGEAEAAGLSTVYQEVNLLPSLTVAENLTLGRQPGRFGFIRWGAARRHARASLAQLGLDLDVNAELGSLPVALQQMVAIARALDRQARVLILDEPTASLDEKEVNALFALLRQLRTEGLGIVFVTHFLDQVYALTDRITVLRNGQFVGEYITASLPRLELVGKMLGRAIEPAVDRAIASETTRIATTAPLLTARGLTRRGALQPTDLTLHPGEVLGLAGLLGSGRTETARLLFGLDRRDGGIVTIKGQHVRLHSPREAIRYGLAFCSEDRKHEGIFPNLSVRENLTLALQARRGGTRALSSAEQTKLCAHYIRALRIKTAGTETPIRHLSGGNQQKVLLARWLATQPALIILDEPTRGIDIGAKAEIEALIAQLRADGIAVLFISSELDEITRNSSRVLVLRDRCSAGEFSGDALTSSQLMKTMAGDAARHD